MPEDKQTYPKMNPEVKKLWLAELRSGKYLQANGQLLVDTEWDDDQGDINLPQPKYCCLGVLCLINGSPEVPSDAEMPEQKTIKWAGLTYNKLDKEWEYEGTAKILADMNDNGKTFAEIADWIEEKL